MRSSSDQMEEFCKTTSKIIEVWVAFCRESCIVKKYPSFLTYHFYTLYLLTASDLINVLWPQLCFSISFVLNPSLNNGSTLDASTIVTRLPHTLTWTWLQLLLLGLSNQRRPASIAEDTLNKPWRSIPSGRLDQHHARHLLLTIIPFTYLLSQYVLGGTFETVALFVFNWIYNDLDAAEDLYLRNVLNALGITTIGAGARAVLARDSTHALVTHGRLWLMICAGVILTTIQIQDLKDQDGDRKRERKTVPLVLGDKSARWLTVLPVIMWSLAIPGYWRIESLVGWVVPILLGTGVIVRMLMYRDIISDRGTYNLWAFWVIGIYMTPVIKMMFG